MARRYFQVICTNVVIRRAYYHADDMERALDVLSSSREGEWVTAEEFCRAARVVADVTLDPQSCSVQAMVSDRKGCEGEDV